MKKLLLLITGLIAYGALTTACAAEKDAPIRVNQLPKAAQEFVTKYFASHKVAMAMKDVEMIDTTYEVTFTNGDKVEFNKKGEWQEVKCPSDAVPAAIVPAEIKQYVATNYPESKIIGIERHRNHYEIDLTGGWDIKFDLKFNVIDFDR